MLPVPYPHRVLIISPCSRLPEKKEKHCRFSFFCKLKDELLIAGGSNNVALAIECNAGHQQRDQWTRLHGRAVTLAYKGHRLGFASVRANTARNDKAINMEAELVGKRYACMRGLVRPAYQGLVISRLSAGHAEACQHKHNTKTDLRKDCFHGLKYLG
jgi:hypothetical protein